MKQVSIIGGGAGGTLALVQLIRQANEPLAVTLYDATGDFARGVAYSTKRPEHVLNVRAVRMGAFPEAPDHFFQWLQSGAGEQAREAWCGDTPLLPTDFAPRGLYGDYISAQLEGALTEAKRKNITVRLAHADVTEARKHDNGFMLKAQGLSTHADILILACGTQSPPAKEGVIEAWKWFASTPGSETDKKLRRAEHVALIGSGLTMVDSALSLARLGFAGRITTFSRHAALPAAHYPQDPAPYPPWALTDAACTTSTAGGLLALLHREARRAQAQGKGWREVVDSLRHATPALWRALDAQQKRRIFARLFTLWNVHRHRMAPHLSAELERMIAQKRLVIMPGYVTDVQETDAGMLVHYTQHGKAQTLSADAVIRCTGPAYDVTRSHHPLLSQLLADGLIQPSSAGAGIATDASYGAVGEGAGRIYAMGALLVGDWFECTAMPELRSQAADIAKYILSAPLTSH